MRCLGIPNTAHFANVTQIEDAITLWDKLKGQKTDEAWKPEQVSIFSFLCLVTGAVYLKLCNIGLRCQRSNLEPGFLACLPFNDQLKS